MAFDWQTAEAKPEKEIVPTRLRPGRAPLLWLLVPLLAAYAWTIAAGAPGTPADCATIALLAGLVAMYASLADLIRWRRRRRAGIADTAFRTSPLWAAAFVVAVFSLGVAHYAASCPPAPVFPAVPATSVARVRVDELFQSATGAISGVATLLDTPSGLAVGDGALVYFRLSKTKAQPAPPPGFDTGAVVVLHGRFARAPEGEGFARYLRQRGVAATLARAHVETVTDPASDFRLGCTRARGRVEQALRQGVRREDAARLAALMLGRTGLLTREERDDFRKAGATHIFAISGLHITGIAAGLVWAARRMRITDTLAMPVILGALWLYVQMAGAPPSAMRAWVMAAGMAAAIAMGRGTRPIVGLVGAAAVTLIAQPGAVRDPGFLLSYVVVAALLLYASPLTEAVDKAWRPWRFIPPDALGRMRATLLHAKRPALAAVATTTAATLAGMPLVAALFGQISLVGLLANLVLVPLSAPPVILGFMSSALGVVGLGEWAGPFNAPAAFCMRVSAGVAHLAADVPASAITLAPSPGWTVGLGAAAVMLSLLVYPPQPDKSAWRYATLPVAVAAYFLFLASR